MNKTQEHLLDLLLEIDEICEKHSLTYYLAGGCLIGAMRNKGFLPWDDDADIHMTREDACALRQLGDEGKLPENRVIVSYRDYPDCPITHWRYIDTSSSLLARSSMVTDTPVGQFIDIFMLVPAPSDAERSQYEEDFTLYTELALHYTCSSLRSDEVVRRYRQWIKLCDVGLTGAMHKHFQRKLFELPEDSSDDYAILSPLPPALFVPKNLFGTPRRVLFEGHEVCVAQRVEEMICHVYGTDWVSVPEVQERGAHNFVIDTDFAYDTYIRDLDGLLDRKKGYDLDLEWKRAWFGNIDHRNHANSTMRQAALNLFALEQEDAWQDSAESLGEAISLHKYDEISTFFKPYYQRQQDENTRYWRLFVPINDRMLWQAWFPVFQQGNYSIVLKMLNMRLKRGELDGRLTLLHELCTDASELSRCIWSTKDFAGAQDIVSKRLAESDPSVIFYRGSIEVEAIRGGRVIDWDRCKPLIDAALEAYPSDGELTYWKAEFLIASGESEQARPLLQYAARHLRNGILLTRTQELLRAVEGVEL